MNKEYEDKVSLLLKILPFVMEEGCFAVHGGTAINLFVNDLTRLSTDIDLTYIPLEEREVSLSHINEALQRISNKVRTLLKGVRITPRLDICKITCEHRGCQVKIEVNKTKRGLIGGDPITMPLCPKGQALFEVENVAKIVPLTLLYGGEISAALTRQHPRDLFDIKHMSISLEEAKRGFVFCLLGSDKPLHESFAPQLVDQNEALENQFSGMSDLPFSYEDFEETRSWLISHIQDPLTEQDKRFLVSFELAEPDWENSEYEEFKKFPQVQWKLLNLAKLKATNPSKLRREADKLRNIFGI